MASESAAAVRMTEGPITSQLIRFAMPLFLGNLFQQLYNTADSLIVGNFIGSGALAAVTSTGAIIFLLIGFFQGVFVGAGVIISRFFGAENRRGLQKAIHTDIAVGLVSGILMTIFGVLATPAFLRWMGTPDSVMADSVIYLRVYFAGAMSFILYNCLVGILQAVGDSRHPLYYLIISSIINVILDLILIALLGMGVGAAAAATVISQSISALLCMRQLRRSPEEYRLHLRKICFHGDMLRKIISNGLPTGFQNSIISVANVVVQANVNAFGAKVMAGNGAYTKIEGFGFLPITCFAMALTTFIGQNLGANKIDRVRKGARAGIILSITMAELIGLIVYLLAPWLIRAFDSDPEVIQAGILRAHVVTLFYFLLAFSHCAAGVLRGAGKAVIPMLIMMFIWCFFRVAYITAAVRIRPVVSTVYWAYPITWFISSIIFLIYLFKGKWLKTEEERNEV